MGNPNSYFFDDNEDKLDEGEELEIAPENPSGDTNVDDIINETRQQVSGILGSGDDDNSTNLSSGNGSVDDVINETRQQVSDILDSGDDDDGDD